MPPRWPWIERTFTFAYPVEKYPDIIERLRGVSARAAVIVNGATNDVLSSTAHGPWSIKDNIGHLIDLEVLLDNRLDDFLADRDTLTGADMSNAKTNAAPHNSRTIDDLLADLARERSRLVDRVESLAPEQFGLSATHPRLNMTFRLVDACCFHCEHDDYHLARCRELVRLHGA